MGGEEKPAEDKKKSMFLGSMHRQRIGKKDMTFELWPKYKRGHNK